MARELANELSRDELGGVREPVDDDGYIDEGPLEDPPTVPHYCMPNFASILPNYSNSDQDYIKLAFSAASWVSTREMPADLANGLQGSRGDKMEDVSRTSAHIPKPPVPTFRKKDVFSEFEYVPSRYSLEAETRAAERMEDEAKRLSIAGKDWAPSGGQRKMKHEDGFADKEYRFPYMSDPYEAARDQTMRAKWIEDSKILHGPFLPGGPGAQDSITRQLLPTILKEVHRVVDEDWGEYIFSVMSTEDDMIVVRFQLDSVDSIRGLHAYMNVFASTGEVVTKYKLTRVVEDWHSEPGDGHLYYMFKPPWVRARGTDTFFTLHPEERTYETGLAASLKPDPRSKIGGGAGGGATTKK